MRRRNHGERGEGQAGCLIGLVLLLIVGLIAWKVIPVKVKAAEMRDTIVDEAKSAGTHRDPQIMKAILQKAEELELPITEENVEIDRKQADITITVNYTVPVEFPGYTYNWDFNVETTNPLF